MTIRWNPDAIRQLERDVEAKLADVARRLEGHDDEEIRRALNHAGIVNIQPELVEMIRRGEYPPARFQPE